VEYENFGKDWVARFMSHYPELETVYRKGIEAARIKNVTVERVTKWFKDLKWIVEERNIGIQNIYNMNQSGFAIGDIEALRRIINAEIR
jgi:hypothetical protein